MKRGKDNPVTPEEIKRIKELREHHTCRQVAAIVKRSMSVVAMHTSNDETIRVKKPNPQINKSVFDWKDYDYSMI